MRGIGLMNTARRAGRGISTQTGKGMTFNTMTGRSAFLSLLKEEGITHLFGNPGTTELPIMHALKDYPELTYVMGMQRVSSSIWPTASRALRGACQRVMSTLRPA
ncbi:glyoxylate carboligase [Bradyrhizobium sp. LB7.1]